MLQEVRRDTTKEVNFRGRKIAPVVKLGHSKIDTIGYYLNEGGGTSYVVVNQMGDTLEMEASTYADAHIVVEKPDRPDFSFLSAMQRIEGVKPCDITLLKKGDSLTASEIISKAGTIQHDAPAKSYPKEVFFSNCVLYTMVFFSVIIATKSLIRLEQAGFRIRKEWSRC